MSKTFVTAMFLTCVTVAHAQQCKCDRDSLLNEAVSCFTLRFKNHTKLYRQFNCDSSWLIFESSAGKKQVLYALYDGMIEYTEKLGYQYAAEYKSSFLIQDKLISGCCTPPEYLLFNKTTGTQIKSLGSLVFYSENINYPFVVSIEKKRLNSLEFYDINTKRSFSVALPVEKISLTLKKGIVIHPEYLFEEATISNNKFSITLQYQNTGDNDNWHDYKIRIDLKKYGYR